MKLTPQQRAKIYRKAAVQQFERNISLTAIIPALLIKGKLFSKGGFFETYPELAEYFNDKLTGDINAKEHRTHRIYCLLMAEQIALNP